MDLITRIDRIERAVFRSRNPLGSAAITEPAVVPPVVYTGAADVLSYPGIAVLAGPVLNAATLTTPVPGTDDGKILTILNAAPFRNTVTTEAGKIVNGRAPASHVIQLAAEVGGSIELMAFDGFWFVIGTPMVWSIS